ncbi:hypothetical protein [Desulfovibrio gilichinskyi]|uniref:Undecaprenyl-diphosphooligosaccharide---protein glycotransferase n=1 Tax=Desulfovibrio gilichinskyi TaxID=1519643 RepID=A0A1X7EIT7_9BACT|nr:hypothetical protein [Desulfovibrio gilichinskyi]SMF34713.1 undecaprenyl-diphosphooligosaccharide---protein glycotransferase [Desulfovibrio gilichinskyi]
MRTLRFTTTTWATIAVIIISVTLSGILALHHSQLLVEQGIHIQGVPLIGNNDGYYYLDQAYKLAEQGVGVNDVINDSHQSMLLSYFLAAVAGLDKMRLQRVSAYLGPILSLSMLLAVLPWGIKIRSPFVMVSSTLLALFAPYWVTRTHVGFLDTDSLVPGLCFFALFCVFQFSTKKVSRLPWVGLYILILFFLWFWWRPGALLSAGFILCYLVYPTRNRLDISLKVLFLCGIIAVTGLMVAGLEPFSQYAAYIKDHASLAFGGTTNSLLSLSIIELRGVYLWQLGQKSLGSGWLLIPAIYGTICYCVHYRTKAIFLAVAWGFGFASIISQRFIPLFIPAVAFFAAYGCIILCSWVSRQITLRFMLQTNKIEYLLKVACLPLLFGCVIVNTVTYQPKTYFSRNDFVLAKKIRATFPSNTLLWTWWDYGYFFKYLTGMDVFFDGGSQTELTCFTAAYPLVQNDMAVAASWIKYFAFSSPDQLNTNKKEQWLAFLTAFTKKIMSTAETSERSVALCLPARVYTTSGYLYSFAHVFEYKMPPIVNHLDLYSKKGFRYEPRSSSVVVPEEMVSNGYDSFGGVLDATNKLPKQLDLDTVPDPYLVFSDNSNFLAVTDRALVESVLFRLLGLFDGDIRYFSPIFFDYRFGGIWSVH